MIGVWKHIEGVRGETRVGPLVGWPFAVERRREGFALVYRPPFSSFVDEVRLGPGGYWVGRSLFNTGTSELRLAYVLAADSFEHVEYVFED